MEVVIDVGGNPGVDCRGFCKYCYFKKVKDIQPLGCKYCLPFKKGCDYCTRSVKESYSGFKPLQIVLEETARKLYFANGEITKFTGKSCRFPVSIRNSDTSGIHKWKRFQQA